MHIYFISFKHIPTLIINIVDKQYSIISYEIKFDSYILIIFIYLFFVVVDIIISGGIPIDIISTLYIEITPNLQMMCHIIMLSETF